MKERPIIFSAPMVRAILACQKTQTRRIAKPVKHPDLGNFYTAGALALEGEPQHVIDRANPFGQPGYRLWVREAWGHFERAPAPGNEIYYRADGECLALQPWRSPIFMPRWASRITLEITGIRIERLQDISDADAIAEGCAGGHGSIPGYAYNATPKEHYRHVWESINGAGSWDANPWVWVVVFRRLEGGAA